MKLRNKSIFMILVAFLKTFQLALLPLLLVVMFLRFSQLKFIHIPLVKIGAIGYICFLSKHPLVYFMTSSWISYLIFLTSCVCMFLYGSLCPLQKLIYMRALIHHLDILVPCQSSFTLLLLVVLVKKIYECLVYFFSSCTHIS